MKMLRRISYSEFIILFVLCLIFYGAMEYYSSTALQDLQNIQAMRHVMLLRMVFNISFSVLLGIIGFKVSGHVWPAALVHAIVVGGMLCMDLSIKELQNDWMLVLIIIATTASITALSGGLALGYYWLRARRRW